MRTGRIVCFGNRFCRQFSGCRCHGLSVVKGEDGIQVGVVVVGDLFQSVGKQVVDINVGFAHAGGS